MAAALFAKLLMKKMRNSSAFNHQLPLLDKISANFEEKASQFLNVFFEEDEESANEMLSGEQQFWYHFTPLELADRGEI